MKRLKWINPRPTDVVILDSLGVPYLEKAIPPGIRWCVVPLRDEIQLVMSPLFFLRWIYFIMKLNFQARKAYYFALIDSYSPKVVLSYADNNNIAGAYQRYRNSTLVISIQNALRRPRSFLALEEAPHYYALGKTACRAFSDYRISHKRCEVGGSLALGIFCSERAVTRTANHLVFVSSYRVGFDRLDLETPTNRYTLAQVKAHKKIFEYSLRYAEESRANLTVLAKGKVSHKGQHFEEEKSYFECLANGKEYTFTSTIKDSVDAYHHALSAELIVGLDSTLLYEAFSVGSKVLFGWGADQYLFESAQSLTVYLPQFALLENDSYDEFVEKLNFLRALNDDDFRRMTDSSRSEYVETNQDDPVHEKISREIKDHIGLVEDDEFFRLKRS
jgi:surface carbohydrate biosynthesis protein